MEVVRVAPSHDDVPSPHAVHQVEVIRVLIHQQFQGARFHIAHVENLLCVGRLPAADAEKVNVAKLFPRASVSCPNKYACTTHLIEVQKVPFRGGDVDSARFFKTTQQDFVNPFVLPQGGVLRERPREVLAVGRVF